MDWKLFWRYALDLAALFPAAFVCLVPVWEFFSRPGRTALAAACFLTLGTLGAAAACAAAVPAACPSAMQGGITRMAPAASDVADTLRPATSRFSTTRT